MCVYTLPLAPRVYIIHALRCIIIGCILNREAVHAYQELVCCTLQTVYSVASRAGCWRRNIFQNKWGTKARILVMVGGGHAALVRRCLIYRGSGRGSGQNPQRPGVRNLGDLARILEGPEADQRFPYLILQFLDIATLLGDYRFSHFLFATLCDLCGIVICLFVADSIGNVILIHTHMTLL